MHPTKEQQDALTARYTSVQEKLINVMPEHHSADKETQEREQKDHVRDFLRRENTGIAIAVWLFIGGFILLRLYIYDRIPAGPGRTTVLIESMFSLAIVIVIVIHAIMYYKQAKALDAQLAQTTQGLQITERAYVGVGGIAVIATRSRDIAKREMQDIALTLENIGRLPADEIRVKVVTILLVPESVQAKYPNSLSRYYYCDWGFDFKSTKLFRGNFNFEITVPLADKIDPILWSRVSGGHARIVLQIRVDYRDGFRPQRADYAFRLEGKWIPWWAWTSDDGDARIAEEIERYPQYAT